MKCKTCHVVFANGEEYRTWKRDALDKGWRSLLVMPPLAHGGDVDNVGHDEYFICPECFADVDNFLNCIEYAEDTDPSASSDDDLLCPWCGREKTDTIAVDLAISNPTAEIMGVFRARALADGMRETTCAKCGRWLLTRGDDDTCPPCRGDS